MMAVFWFGKLRLVATDQNTTLSHLTADFCHFSLGERFFLPVNHHFKAGQEPYPTRFSRVGMFFFDIF